MGAKVLAVRLFKDRSLSESYRADDPEAAAVVRLFDAVYGRYRARLGSKLLAPSEVERRALTLMRHPEALARLVGALGGAGLTLGAGVGEDTALVVPEAGPSG